MAADRSQFADALAEAERSLIEANQNGELESAIDEMLAEIDKTLEVAIARGEHTDRLLDQIDAIMGARVVG